VNRLNKNNAETSERTLNERRFARCFAYFTYFIINAMIVFTFRFTRNWKRT